MRMRSARATGVAISQIRAASLGGYEVFSTFTRAGSFSMRIWMEVGSMFTPFQAKSTWFTPFCRVITRSSSTRVAC